MNEIRELRPEPAARRCGPIELRMPADAELVSVIRLAASGMAATARCSLAEIDDVKLAVSEVLLALIEHGSGPTLSVAMELSDSRFAISAASDTQTFDRDHPDLALCETVLAEVCCDHSIQLVDSQMRIVAGVDLSRSDER